MGNEMEVPRLKSKPALKDIGIVFDKRKVVETPCSLICPVCGLEVNPEKDLLKSFSTLHFGYAGCVPACKDCLNKILDHYLKIFNGDAKYAMKRLCQKYDIYYNEGLAETSCSSKRRKKASYYIGRINSLQQYEGKTFDDSLDENPDAFESEIKAIEIESAMKEIPQDVIEFWSGGIINLSKRDYEYLTKEYNEWASNDVPSKSEEQLYKRICFKQLEILKATEAGENTKDLDKSLQDLMASANVKPKNNAQDISDTQTMGTLLQKWELEKPLPEIDPELQDVDNIGAYINIFFKGHLAKMMGMKNGMSKLYDKFIEKYTVKKPEYEDDETTEALMDSIFEEQYEDF